MSFLSASPKRGWSELKTIFPKVISASRATDIPAFHSDWFMERLREGHCEWQNPFNASQKQRVSFADVQAIVFWSKNPSNLVKYLDEITDTGKKFYFQFTLNDYGYEGLEHGLTAIEERIKIFKNLAKKYKLIWRYDPVILGDTLTVKRHIQKISFIMKNLADYTDKLVFSFVDLYGMVEKNLKKYYPELRAPRIDEMERFSQELAELRDRLAPRLKLATCAEVDMDFARLDIKKNSCIDPVLINELCGQEIYKRKSSKKTATRLSLMDISSSDDRPSYEKDKGQRQPCLCGPSKDIGSYRLHQCGHHCVYCYAHHASKTYPS